MFKRLREIRKAQGFTCELMAKKLGCTKGTYSKKERGQITMTLEEARKIAHILSNTLDGIFFESKVSL